MQCPGMAQSREVASADSSALNKEVSGGPAAG